MSDGLHKPARVEAIVARRVKPDWNPEFTDAVQPAEARGQDADHRVLIGIQGDGLADNVRICAEAGLPKVMAENGYARGTWFVLVRGECAAQLRGYAQ